jgi:hypothetical protein
MFSRTPRDLGEIRFWVTRRWATEVVTIREFPQFLSMVIRGTKADFVIDPLSFDEARATITLENGHSLSVDSIRSIASNKLGTVAGRREPKDYVDLYFIMKQFPDLTFDAVFEDARKKDALFDDPPTAAFQIEEGAAFIASAKAAWPAMRKPLDRADLFGFYRDIARWLYERVKI